MRLTMPMPTVGGSAPEKRTMPSSSSQWRKYRARCWRGGQVLGRLGLQGPFAHFFPDRPQALVLGQLHQFFLAAGALGLAPGHLGRLFQR